MSAQASSPTKGAPLVNSEKYIGLDVHQATISVAVMDSMGKLIMESILETKAATILEFVAGLRGTLSVTFEEGTWAAWLYDLLKPHVDELVVCNPRKIALLKDGNKSDRIDARKLAERLRLNDLKPVYHGETGVRMLRELARSYLNLVKDQTRVMNRLKAMYRSWAICGSGRLLRPPSRRVAGKDSRGRRAASSRAPLSATGHAATLAPASSARTASGESPASHHRQAPADSVARAHSLRAGGGSDPDAASFSYPTPAVGLQRTGVGNSHQRRIPLRRRPNAALQKTDFNSRPEQGSQSRSERSVQRRRY